MRTGTTRIFIMRITRSCVFVLRVRYLFGDRAIT